MNEEQILTTKSKAFTDVQKQYLNGFFSALKQRPFPGGIATEEIAAPSSSPTEGEEPDRTWWGVPLEDLSKEELIKREKNPLDIYDRVAQHAQQGKFPENDDVFRWKYNGLFYVAPAQDSFMMRICITGNILQTYQLRGLAEIAHEWGGGYGDVTTRGNIQIREIKAENTVNCLMKLAEVGLSSRGTGADNIRNITASPTAGIDPQELYDVRPLARAMQYYIVNHRDLYGLPRKFNICFDGGGSISVVSDTNDIGFKAVTIKEGHSIPAGIYFQLLLGGITGHRQLASDTNILVKPEECVAVGAAFVRAFNETGDRTNRKKARLKYVIDRLGIDGFIERVEAKLAFPLLRTGDAALVPSHPVVRHAHIGVHRQKQSGLNYIGVLLPVGRIRAKQMIQLTNLTEEFGTGEIRTTVWQNLLIPNIPDDKVETVKRRLRKIGFDFQATSFRSGVVACTSNQGCHFTSTNTKGHAAIIMKQLESTISIDRPINIHLTGCPHSWVQHYIGDIGLLGAVVTAPTGDKVEGYHIYVGGGCDDDRGIARELFKGIPFDQVPSLVEKMIAVYKDNRRLGESFNEFTRRQETGALQERFGAAA